MARSGTSGVVRGVTGMHADALALGGLAIAIAATFANGLTGAFVLDARALVLGNPAIRAATWDNIRTILTSDYWWPLGTTGVYRPLTTLSFLVNHAVVGPGAGGYRAANVVLHWACSACVFAMLRRARLAAVPAFLGTLVFGLHPAASEVVTNIAGRADLLAALAVLVGLLCHARAATARGRRRLAWSAALLASATVGVFSKENAVVLLPLVVLQALLLLPGPPAPRRLLVGAMPVLVPIIIMAVARGRVLAHGWPPEISAVDNPILELGFWRGQATALEVVAMQLGTLVWPLRLSADYSYDQIPTAGTPLVLGAIAGGAALVALVAAVFTSWWRAPRLAFFVGFVAIAMLPTANLLVVIGSIRADRFLYLPLAGVAGIVACALAAPPLAASMPRRRLAMVVVVAVAVLLAARTVRRNRDWSSDAALWRATVVAAPRSVKAHKAFAAALFGADPRVNLGQAIAEAETAVRIRPDHLPALVDLASYWIAKGELGVATTEADAAAAYRRAVSILRRARAIDRRISADFHRRALGMGHEPTEIPSFGNSQLYEHLGLAQARLGRFRGAASAYRHLRHLDTLAPDAHVNLAASLANLGRWNDAASVLFGAEALFPDDVGIPSRIVDIYGHVDATPAPLIRSADGATTLAADAPVVQRDRCRGLRDLVRVLENAALHVVADRLRARTDAACRDPST